MVSAKTILFICLSSRAAAQDTTCANTYIFTEHLHSTSQGEFRISRNNAIAASHQAPLSDKKTKTSYPHWLTNGYNGDGNAVDPKNKPPIKFPVGKCNNPSKHSDGGSGKDDHYLLEFPLKKNGKLYPFDKKPKKPTEPARLIYTYPDKVFCGIVVHTQGSKGPHELCRT